MPLKGGKIVTLLFVFLGLLGPLPSQADVIYLKNGRQIETTRSWEEGSEIKCERFGSVVGYPKSSVLKVEKSQVAAKKCMFLDWQKNGGLQVDFDEPFDGITMEAWVCVKEKDIPRSFIEDCLRDRKACSGLGSDGNKCSYAYKQKSKGRFSIDLFYSKHSQAFKGKRRTSWVSMITIFHDGCLDHAIPGRERVARPHAHSSYRLPANRWFFISQAYDPETMTGILYVDGKEVSRCSFVRQDTAGLSDHLRTIVIGRNGYGYVDEVRIWDRRLPREEIMDRMGRTLEGTEKGLVAYYNFDDEIAYLGDGSKIVKDHSSQGNDAFVREATPYFNGETPGRKFLIHENAPVEYE